jgi:O-antigen/teichoic acid export membrane protein
VIDASGPPPSGFPPGRGRTEGLAQAARRGLVFTGGTYAARASLEFGTSVVLARLLSPGDFGVVAVGQAFLQLSYVVGNLGMGAAVVQARDLSEADRRAATTVSTASALLLALMCAAAAPWAAAFFAMPVLRPAMPIMAGEIVLSGLAATPTAILRRRLHYGRAAAVDLGSGLVYALVSITLALLGHGIWSLVWTPLVSGTWSVIASHALAGHRHAFGTDRSAVRRLLSFGGGLTAKNVFVHMARHADNLVVARTLGDYATGLYTRAFSLSTLPQSRLVSVIYGVSFPVFCRLQEDRERFHAWYLKATSVAALIVTPLLLGLAVVAPDFTVVVYGEAWSDMAGCLRVLCIAGLLNSIHMLGGAAIEASGRLRYEVAAQSIYGVMIPLGAFVGSRWGIRGVAFGVLFAALTFYVNKAWALRRAIGLDIAAYVAATLPILGAGAVMAIVVLLVRAGAASAGWSGSPVGRLFAGVVVGALAYGACLLTFARRHLRLAIEQVAAMRRVGGRQDDLGAAATTPP